MCFWIGAYQLYPFLFMEASTKGDNKDVFKPLCRSICTHKLPSRNCVSDLPSVSCIHLRPIPLFRCLFICFCFEKKSLGSVEKNGRSGNCKPI